MTTLLLSTHGRLLFSNGTVLHEGCGIYYGAFKSDDDDGLWVTSRGPSEEKLIQIDTTSGTIIKEKKLPSVFTHDLIRCRNRVYITDCNGGNVVVLDYPSLDILKILKVCTRQNHINTVAIDPNGNLWCLLHNLGKSLLIMVDKDTGTHLETCNNYIGVQSHGLSWWKGGFLILSSGTGELLHVAKETKILWTDSDKKFLKGLCVVDSIAYFGISCVTPRTQRGSPDLNCELAAFNLNTGKLLWRKEMMTVGLLNSIMAI